MLIWSFVFLNSILFTAVNHPPSFFDSATREEDIPEPDQLMGRVIDKSVEEITKKYGFSPIGVGMSGKFEGAGLSFRVYRPLRKDEARRILFDCAEILLKNINSSKKLQPYLNSYPFTLQNVGITIYSTNENYVPFSHPYPSVSCIGNGELIFRTKEEGKEFGYKEVTKETYEEARAILNKAALCSKN